MRTYARLEALKEWTREKVCKGRLMKVEPQDRDITRFEKREEPAVYIAFAPKRYDESNGQLIEQLRSAAPSITILPAAGNVKYVEPERFDQYNGVHRPQDYGQQLNVQMLFTVYEDDLRLPGFIDTYEQTGRFDLTRLREGTQEGLQTLMDWMDDFNMALLGQRIIPGTDLILRESAFEYGMRADQRYISDNRPLYYGICNVSFACVAEEDANPEIEALLD